MEEEEDREGPAGSVGELTLVCLELAEHLQHLETEEEKRRCVVEHITCYTTNKIPMVEFQQGLEWFNVERPLSLAGDLRGRVAVLDFFTYCCINCLHILPDLQNLEHRHPPAQGQAVVVGVHSAKFDNERVSGNILAAVERHNIEHPVVNDARASMWTALGITCWPTLLILGPSGQPLFVLVGEGHIHLLHLFVDTAIHHFSHTGELKGPPLPLVPSAHCEATESPLLYPGKVAVHPAGLIIADSGHNRVLLTDWQGSVTMVVGSGRRDLTDGSFSSASFSNPQGVCYHHPDTVFVADTDNHAVRRISLQSRSVTTIAGTGTQGKDLEGGKTETAQAISSPWDVVLTRSLDRGEDEAPNLLLVAMAGTHQIWAIFLSDGQWLKGQRHGAGTVVRVAGSGAEENRNTSYPLRAGFAQPSGLAVSPSHHPALVYVADAESSCVRSFSLGDGAVRAVVGGARDPLDLFAYGDADGSGVEAKLQHPLAVAAAGADLIVADSYNHKLKVVRPSGKTYTISTLNLVTDGAGDDTDTKLNEPGGLCAAPDGSHVYIADTNNHLIKIMSLSDYSIKRFAVRMMDESDSVSGSPEGEVEEVVYSAPHHCPAPVTLRLLLELCQGSTLNTEAPNTWTVHTQASSLSFECLKGPLHADTYIQFCLQDGPAASEPTFRLSCTMYVCVTSGVCVMKHKEYHVVFKYDETSPSDAALELSLKIKGQ